MYGQFFLLFAISLDIAGGLQGLDGKSFQVAGVDFVEEFFPEAGKRIFEK